MCGTQKDSTTGIVVWLYLDQYDQLGQQDTVKLQTKYKHN